MISSRNSLGTDSSSLGLAALQLRFSRSATVKSHYVWCGELYFRPSSSLKPGAVQALPQGPLTAPTYSLGLPQSER